jgi:hypothetical protein
MEVCREIQLLIKRATHVGITIPKVFNRDKSDSQWSLKERPQELPFSSYNPCMIGRI